MPHFINAFVCEKVLQEKDEVTTAVRLVDIFYIHPHPSIPIEERAVTMTVLVTGRSDKPTGHALDLKIERPNGEVQVVGDPIQIAFTTRLEIAPPGFVVVAPFAIVARQLGVHWLTVWLDQEEVCRIPITLAELQPESNSH